MVGNSVPPGATLTELQDLHLPGLDLGSIVQDWQHGLHHDWYMPG
jgi:hypothetical protein